MALSTFTMLWNIITFHFQNYNNISSVLLGLIFWYFALFFNFLFVSACVYVSLHDFVSLFLLLPFVLGFCLFDCLGFLCFFLFFVLFFLLPFLPCHVACRGLVLCLGVGSEPPRWESQVQDIRPPKNSWPCGKLIGECSPEVFISTLRPGSTQQPASSSAGRLMPNN